MFYRIGRFITSFTRTHHLSLCLSRRIYSTPPRPSLRYILILSSHLLLCLQSGFFPSPLPTEILICISLLPSTCHMPRLFPTPWFGHPDSNVFGEEHKPRSSSLCNFLQSPLSSSFLGPNTFLCTLFSNVLSLCFSKSDNHIRHATLQLCIYYSLYSNIMNGNTETVNRIAAGAPPIIVIFIASCIQFWYVSTWDPITGFCEISDLLNTWEFVD